MSYNVITLTQNGDYFEMYSKEHKTDLITVGIGGVFDGAKLVETRAYQDSNGATGITHAVPVVNSSGVQIEISVPQQLARSTPLPSLVYRYTLENAGGSTNIEIIFDGIRFDSNKKNNIQQF
jgi:hypothetical protein